MVDEPSVYPQTLNLDSGSHSINLSWVHIDLRFCSELECGIYKSKASWTTLISNIYLVLEIPWGFCLNKDTQFNWIFKYIEATSGCLDIIWQKPWEGTRWGLQEGYQVNPGPAPSMCEKLGVWGGRKSKHNLVKGLGGCKLPIIHRDGWIQRESLPA